MKYAVARSRNLDTTSLLQDVDLHFVEKDLKSWKRLSESYPGGRYHHAAILEYTLEAAKADLQAKETMIAKAASIQPADNKAANNSFLEWGPEFVAKGCLYLCRAGCHESHVEAHWPSYTCTIEYFQSFQFSCSNFQAW